MGTLPINDDIMRDAAGAEYKLEFFVLLRLRKCFFDLLTSAVRQNTKQRNLNMNKFPF